MLMKSTLSANFTNILRAAWAPILFCQKITKPNSKWRKSVQNACTWKICLKNAGEIDYRCQYSFAKKSPSHIVSTEKLRKTFLN